MPAPYTPCPAGFITTRHLPDGRYLVEAWILNLDPYDSDLPRHDINECCIVDTAAQAETEIDEMAAGLVRPLGTLAA